MASLNHVKEPLMPWWQAVSVDLSLKAFRLIFDFLAMLARGSKLSCTRAFDRLVGEIAIGRGSNDTESSRWLFARAKSLSEKFRLAFVQLKLQPTDDTAVHLANSAFT